MQGSMLVNMMSYACLAASVCLVNTSPMAFYLILVCLKIEYHQNQWFITILNLPTKIAIWPLS